ncbi:MAG TPA: hypothetical protein VH328_09130 [Burkholderiaceae bacterium]|nr:hypothetical protein [Burkholderiaceae bacterium]
MMPSASRPAFLRHFRGAKAHARELDLGDMGTALALEETLDEKPLPIAAQTPASARGVVRVAPWRLWLGRKLGSN